MNAILNVTARRDALVVHWLMATGEADCTSKSSADTGRDVMQRRTGAVNKMVALLSVDTARRKVSALPVLGMDVEGAAVGPKRGGTLGDAVSE